MSLVVLTLADFSVIHCLFRQREMEGKELTGGCTVCQVKLINLNACISSCKILLIEFSGDITFSLRGNIKTLNIPNRQKLQLVSILALSLATPVVLSSGFVIYRAIFLTGPPLNFLSVVRYVADLKKSVRVPDWPPHDQKTSEVSKEPNMISTLR